METRELEWKTVRQGKDTYNRYKISEYGDVWDLDTGKEVAQCLSGKPQYYYVNIRKDNGDRKLKRVNNLIAWTFHGNPPTPKHTADHIDQDKFNNHKSNIRWADKRTQMGNRGNTKHTTCGVPVVAFLRGEGFEDLESGKGAYYTTRLRKGIPYTDIHFEWAAFLKPDGKLTRRLNKHWVEYKGICYPSFKSLCTDVTPVHYKSIRQRIRKGLTLEEALSVDPVDMYRFNMNGFFMTRDEHCTRLCISLGRIEGKMARHNISFAEACSLPIERVTRHCINGTIRRNNAWAEHYNLPPKTFNSFLNRTTKALGKHNIRMALEHYGINTSGLEIYPCDGEVVMYNNPV